MQRLRGIGAEFENRDGEIAACRSNQTCIHFEVVDENSA